MHCSACTTENPESSKHCSECGAPLARVCSGCGSQNPATAKFCSDCGHSLAVESSPATATPAPFPSAPDPNLGDGERKIITVLFADIQDSMDLLESLDPEDARRLVDPALALMVEVVRRFDGHVVPSTGDGIFALFGAPIAHEDHPQRAIYAALELQERIRRYSDSLRESGRLPIFVRVGVNTGEVVVRSVRTDDARVEYTPIGHPTSLASRLQSLATPGTVVVGEQTRKLSEGFFYFRVLAPRHIKGVSQPVIAYEVTELGPRRTRLEAAARRGLVKFVGRDAELHEMKRAFERAQSGQGRIVAVVGDAGVGKSRLFHQFKATFGGECMLLETSGIAHAKTWVYLPLVELLQKYFELQTDDEPEKRRQKITRRVTTLDPGLLDAIPYLNALLGISEADDPIAGMDPQLRKQRTLDAMKRLLVRESLAQPLIVIFEDLHWFDAESLEFLTLLADSLASLRVLMLVNHRPEFVHPSGGKSYYRQLKLDPLEANASEELLSGLVTDGGELRPLKELIIAKSEGNPLFIEEIVRALFESGTIVRDGDEVRVTRPHAEISIPATVEGIVASRIDRLPPAEKSLLQALAVIGEEFPLPVARQALGKPEGELLASLAYLQAAEFIYEHPTVAQTEYTFKHALIHDVAYKSVLQERRKVIHGKTAEAIETLYANRLDDHLDKLVHHYRLSGNGSKTAHYLHQAGQHAYERSAVAEALVHFNAALQTVGQLPSDAATAERELALQISLGNALMSIGGFAAQGIDVAFERARALCGLVGDSSQLVPALFGLWAFHNFGGNLKAAQELGEELLSIAERRGDPAGRLMAHTSLGITMTYSGELRVALEHCTQGVSIYSPAQRLPAFLAQARSSCRTWLALVMALTGHPGPALRVSNEAVQAARESSQTVSISNALIGAGVLTAVLADPAATRAWSEELIDLAAQQGFVLASSWAHIQHGYALALGGQPAPGIAQILEGLATVHGARALTALAQSGCWLAESYSKAGETENASSALAEAFNAMEKTGERLFEPELHRVRGEVVLLSESSDSAEAERCFRIAIDIARRQGAKLWELRSATSLARLFLEHGRRDEAVDALTPIYSSLPDTDVADLRTAKSLLKQLHAPASS
jgi:class 3 adenylate cyclase/predicted ATPase